MYHKHHTKGLVIQSKGEGNDSRRVYLFTEKLGLLNARVQGARNIKSKLRVGAQEFAAGEFSLIHGRSGWKLVSVRVDKFFFELLRYSPTKMIVMGNVLNLIKKLVGEDEGNESLFNVISNFLDFLVTAKEDHLSLAECLVLLRILHFLGYVRHEPEFGLPLVSQEIEPDFLEQIAPRRVKMIELINESLKATHLT